MHFSGLRADERGDEEPSTQTDKESTASRRKPRRRRRSLVPRRVREMSKLPEDGLKVLRNRLGLSGAPEAEAMEQHSAPISVADTDDLARPIIYSPDIDGHAEAGEIIWLWVPVDGPSKPPAERAMLVIGETRYQELLGLLISSDGRHDGDQNWLSIGPGQWNESGAQSWVRIDKVIQVPEHAVRRQGILLPERRFDRIARALHSRFGWQ